MKRGNELQLCRCELKYCERCGALWVRRAGREESYCSACTDQMEDLPKARVRSKGRRERDRGPQEADLQAIAADCVAGEAAVGADAMLEKARAL
jgi:hypothetical protein